MRSHQSSLLPSRRRSFPTFSKELGRKFQALRRSLLEWGRRNYRDFPWRRPSSAYASLIAEVFLQRTKAGQVLPVYREFLQRFPNPEAIQQASYKEVHVFVRRLGLFWRTRKIKRMAAYVVEKLGGRIPSATEELVQIPSVGSYVSAAVRSFYYGKADAVIDSNIARFYVRFFGIKPASEPRRQREVRETAKAMITRKNHRRLNLALLDFTWSVCVPRNPRCPDCILNKICKYALMKLTDNPPRQP